LAGGLPNILRISSGDGIPGVGVAPGFAGLIFEPSGIPGVGVAPLGTAPFELTPGTFAGCCIGLAESPGGRFAGSRLTATGAAFVAVVFAAFEALEFEVLAAPPQANEKDANRASVDIWTVLFIFTVSALRCRSVENDADSIIVFAQRLSTDLTYLTRLFTLTNSLVHLN
jgi:hypothetical protein